MKQTPTSSLRGTQQSYLSCLSRDDSSSRTSSHGIIFAFPESMSAIRREISSSQAFSAPSSTVLSRLASRESARAALFGKGESLLEQIRRLLRHELIIPLPRRHCA